MSAHDYTPEEALSVLLRKVREKDNALADRVQVAIDAGKDIYEEERPRTRRQKPRKYRRKVAYSHEEALGVALDVLQAHFVELPLFINSAKENFKDTAIGIPTRSGRAYIVFGRDETPLEIAHEGVLKEIEVELQTETRISLSNKDTQRLEQFPPEQIKEEVSHIDLLRKLIHF